MVSYIYTVLKEFFNPQEWLPLTQEQVNNLYYSKEYPQYCAPILSSIELFDIEARNLSYLGELDDLAYNLGIYTDTKVNY